MAKTSKTANRIRKPASKQDQIIKLLNHPKGASLAEIGKASGWQEHSIRGFMSGTLKKKLQLKIESDKDIRGVRRYKIVEGIKQEKQPTKAMTVESGA